MLHFKIFYPILLISQQTELESNKKSIAFAGRQIGESDVFRQQMIFFRRIMGFLLIFLLLRHYTTESNALAGNF